jgi:hypothetical protein
MHNLYDALCSKQTPALNPVPPVLLLLLLLLLLPLCNMHDDTPNQVHAQHHVL